MPQAPQGEARQGPALTSAFGISLLLKGADAVLEAIGGVLMLVVSPDGVNRLVVALTQHELSEDPGDFFALHLRQAASHFGSSRSFAAAYLLSHGLGKLVLVAAIFRGRLWAYPAMIILLLLFIAYQLFRMGEAFTVGMLALTVFDAAIVWLTCGESGVAAQLLVRKLRSGLHPHHEARTDPLVGGTSIGRCLRRASRYELWPRTLAPQGPHGG